MTILVFASLSFLVFAAGLILWFWCSGGIKKATLVRPAEIMMLAGLLAFLIASGGRLESCGGSGAGGGGGGSGQRR